MATSSRRTSKSRSPRTAAKSRSSGDPSARLQRLAGNLWWTWDADAQALFRDADPKTFEATGHNAWLTVRRLSAARKRQLAADLPFGQRLAAVEQRFQRYLAADPWADQRAGTSRRRGPNKAGLVAYFCMEYGLHESLMLYAGGLGILAGDHLKSASDLGLPLVAVGMYWHRGYTDQQIDSAGEQADAFPRHRIQDQPLVAMKDADGKPLRIKMTLGKDPVQIAAWCANVGRIPLILLDTNLRENAPRHRKIVDILYSGDRDMRMRQEIVLAVGGWRVLRALDMPIGTCHLNEGHAAILSLERIAEEMEKPRRTLKKAMDIVRDTTVFTTHTPVPAGNEVFDLELVDQYLDGYRHRLGLEVESFHDLGRVKPGRRKEPFGLTPLALRTARYANGVSALHGHVARKMWKSMYPGRKTRNVPIGHVTNGVHLQTWLHPRMAALLDDTLGASWPERQHQASLWKRIQKVSDEDLWALHQEFKAELIAFCRARLKDQHRRSRVPGLKLSDLDMVLDPDALTIGFARRFASYKRATLIFRDAARLAKILNDKRRPVQLIFAGKAHPADTEGKAIIKSLVQHARQKRFFRRVVFLEGYDMDVARHMVAGVDVWLNNPKRPHEASGTSGMKPAVHGGLNLSILDGWWPEGYNRKNGWSIGRAVNHDGTEAADRRDATELYRLLQREVAPLYYRRNSAGLPVDWVARMKNAIMTIPPVFNSHRQVKEYWTKYYRPGLSNA